MTDIDRLESSPETGGATADPIYQEMLYAGPVVAARIHEIGGMIIESYRDVNPLFVCLQRGGNPFASQLMFSIAAQAPSFHPVMDYMTVATYANSRVPKKPKIKLDLAPSTVVKDRPTIMLDDVLDTGVTGAFVEKHLYRCGAASVDLIVLVQKIKAERNKRKVWQNATISGFETPDVWLTGYGMDDARLGKEANRWLAGIAIANGGQEAEETTKPGGLAAGGSIQRVLKRML